MLPDQDDPPVVLHGEEHHGTGCRTIEGRRPAVRHHHAIDGDGEIRP
jgi:hypothetical protein